MKSLLSASSVVVAAAAILVSASPLEPRVAQVAHLTFLAGPASYKLDVPADGTEVKTNSDLNINLISAPDYSALSQCKFVFKGVTQPTLAQHITSSGDQQIAVGPPSVLESVECLGSRVPVYGMCYDTNGQYVGSCCNGYCAATRCRPWTVGG